MSQESYFGETAYQKNLAISTVLKSKGFRENKKAYFYFRGSIASGE